MKAQKNKKSKRTLEEIQLEANKYKTRGDFVKGNNAIYRAAKKRDDFEQIVCHMNSSKTKAYTLEEIQLEANKYTKRSEFQKHSNGYYQSALKRHNYEQIVAHMDPSATKAYVLEEIQLEANKYTKRNEFAKYNPSIYNAAWNRLDFEQIVAHMDKPSNKPYTLEEIQLEANKHTKLESFYTQSPSIYQAALRKEDFLQITSHLKKKSGPSIPELALLEIIREIYPKAQKLIDRKVKIEGKPHIGSFEIDIYIPELRKGIEYDGPYHHSFEGLKRGHPTWPDEDIAIYHELKDGWFSSKDIEIIHIKGEDWKKDRDGCIKICLAFISNK